jgi:glycosyltransferase involved in cell wall biosynthesis
MRIAHVITRLILGGAQENTLLCCEDLRRDYGDEVLLITGPPAGPEGSLLERARGSGIPLEIIPALRRAIQPWHDLCGYGAIRRSLREFQADVVHTHSAKAGILGRAAAWSLRVPAIVHTVHGAPFHPYQSRLARALIRRCEHWAAQRCHAMVSVADAMTDLMVAAGVAPREMFTTVYSGMEVEPFLQAGSLRAETRRQLGYRDEHVVVGKIARLFHLKGHSFVIEAARQVVAQQPQVRFLVVGDGLLRARLQRQIAAARLEPYFQFTGLVPPERIPALVAACDMVVHASLREGLARVLPQALIAGRPAISFDVDGAREVVIPGCTGYLIAPGQIAALSQAILELACDPALREQMGAEGRRRCADVFRHQRMTAQLRGIYARLLTDNLPATSGQQRVPSR